MKKLTITLTDDNHIETQAEPAISLEDLIDLTLSAILGAMNATKEQAKEEHQEQLTEYLFAMFNDGASALLAQFAPDIDLRPDITAEAIMELEERNLDKQLEGQLDLLEQED